MKSLTEQKRIRKIFSIPFQVICLAAVLVWLISRFVDLGTPPVFERDQWTQRDGFIAITYTSLSKKNEEDCNSVAQFTEHLAVLKEAGYNCVTGEDILNFYNNDRPLPEKALYIMLEGGRKDSAVFGQEALGKAAAHAAFFTYTDTMLRGADFFADERDVLILDQSEHWEVGSQGHRLHLLPESPEGKPTFFLCDYARDAAGERLESDDALAARFREFYRLSWEPLSEYVQSGPRVFVFPPANSFHTMPEEVKELNRELMRQYFDLAFTRVGPAFNAAGQDIRDLTRMRVPPDMSGAELVVHLRRARLEKEDYAPDRPEQSIEWLTFKSEVRCEEADTIYIPEEKHTPVPAFLQGSHAWEDVDLSVRFFRENTRRMLYLRYASNTSFIRASVSGNQLLVEERVPGVGLRHVYDALLPAQDSWKLRLLLKGNRLRIFLDDEPLPGAHLPLSRAIRRGHLGLAAHAEAGERAVFGKLKAASLPDLWRVLQREETEAGHYLSVNVSVIQLPATAKESEDTLMELLHSTGAGELAVAALPPGDTVFNETRLRVAGISPDEVQMLWSGVMLTPDPSDGWEEVDAILRRIRISGHSPVLRLSLAAAESLAASGHTLDADKFLLDCRHEDLAPAVWRVLANRHNSNDFLYRFDDSDEMRGFYAPRKL
jgi:hypothetical protein